MIAYGRIRFACELEEEVDFKHDLASLLIVEDVRYKPRRWSWEVFSGDADSPMATGIANSLGAAKNVAEQFVKRAGYG